MKLAYHKFCAVHDAATNAAAAFSAIGLLLIVSFYVYEVFTRYVFNSPTAWVSDFVSYGLCAVVFLALPKVTADKGHVAVTVLVDQLPERAKERVQSVICGAGVLCLGFASFISAQENLRQYTKDIETLAIIPIPQWWVSSFITFGLFMSALHMLRQVRVRPSASQSCTPRGGN